MTHALMIPAMRANSTTRNVAAGVVGDTMTARGTMTVGSAIMTGAHANMTEGMDVNHANTIAATMIGGIELLSYDPKRFIH